jgi:hypothetical protein
VIYHARYASPMPASLGRLISFANQKIFSATCQISWPCGWWPATGKVILEHGNGLA